MELAVSKHRWSLRLLGIWPDRDSLSELRFLITLGLIVSVIIPQLVDLCRNDRETVIENLSSLIPCILVTIKLLIIRLNMRKLRECLNAVAQDWEQEWEPDLRDEFTGVMRRNAKIGRSFNIACTVLLYVTALGLLNNFQHRKSKVKSILKSSYLLYLGSATNRKLIPGFLSLPFTVPDPPDSVESLHTIGNLSHPGTSTLRLPLRAIYFFDPMRSYSPIFEFTYIWQCLGIVAGATANFSIDSFLALLVLHFCGQLEILGKIIERYRGITNHDEFGKIYYGCCPCITCIVEKHLRIISFSEILEDSFHPMLLVQIFGNSILFCFLGYQIIMNFEDSEAIGIATFLVFMLTMMFHLFLYSYVGEQIMEKSEAIGYSAYKTAWYDFHPTDSKSLILLMGRAKKSLHITAGKFFIMSLENYTDILKTSATYLSVLRAVKPVNDG